ncbi:MAG: MMPL family transporter [Gaiellaceae bacterium]
MARSRLGLTEKVARTCARRPKLTLALWGLVVLVSMVLVATSLRGLSSDGNVTGHPESVRAATLIDKAFPSTPAELRRRTSDVIIVHSSRYTVDTPQFRALVGRLVEQSRATGEVSNGASYLSGARSLVSRDRHAALIQLYVPDDAAVKPVVSLVQKANRSPGFDVAITGERTANSDFAALSQRDLEQGELAFGLPAALIVLVLVFGAVIAGLVPLLMALVSIVVGLGVVALLSLEFGFSVFIVNMLTGMGLALGIDYSLFILSRYREERSRALGRIDAIAVSGATASRAVLFSGSTFVVALLGMFIVPTTVMRSLAVGAIVVGVVSVVAALTLLPALLGLVGDRVNALRVPVLGRSLDSSGGDESRFWSAIIDGVLRRPVISLVLSVGVMLAAAVPVLGLHTGESGVGSLPGRLPSKQGYLALQREFPAQTPYPAQVVVQGGEEAVVARDLARLRAQLAADPHFGPGTIEVSKLQDVSMLSAPVRGEAAGDGAIRALRDLRSRILPAALGGSGATVLIGGKTALYSDYFDSVTKPAPYVLALVLGLSFLLLMVAFRSIVVAAVSILLNLLSVGAAYGLLTLVFLKGVGAGLFGFEHATVIDAWVPLFLFSVLFGLSMDYQVFLMSRIKERYDESGSAREAVFSGVVSTARIVTGAAMIIIVVFAGFAKGEMVAFQQMGLGVAVALLLDATVIRSVVLPSAMSLLGDFGWYLPRWLEWLPRLDVERRAMAPVAEAEASTA